MDGNPPDDPENSSPYKAKRLRWPSTALEQDKKTAFWMGGVMECFSTVLSLFNKADLKPMKDDGWEVPHEEISNYLFIGAGAQGVVYRALFRGEFVAVKQLVERREANIKHLQKLNHENIVRFRGVSINGPIPCIIMEYCSNGPLYHYLQSNTNISAKQTFSWAKEIALGMAYLHTNKIIHRDLKSLNLLIANQLTVKVSDFGNSRVWNNVSTVMSFSGTVAWMAPEIIRNEPCSEKVDVWSFGVVLWELLTKETPYKDYEVHAVMWGVGTDALSLPIPESCPENIRQLLQQCWHRIPRSRPTFKIIAANLEFTGDQVSQSLGDSFSATQSTWRKEIKEAMKFVLRPSPRTHMAESRTKESEEARRARVLFEKQMTRANDVYLEVCSLKLQIEQRERDVTEREEALKNCKCSVKKGLKYVQRAPGGSSSSDTVEKSLKDRQFNQHGTPSRLVVNYVSNKPVSVAVRQDNVKTVMKDVTDGFSTDTVDNANPPTLMMNPPNTNIETEITRSERNGNIVRQRPTNLFVNDNYIPPIAHV